MGGHHKKLKIRCLPPRQNYGITQSYAGAGDERSGNSHDYIDDPTVDIYIDHLYFALVLTARLQYKYICRYNYLFNSVQHHPRFQVPNSTFGDLLAFESVGQNSNFCLLSLLKISRSRQQFTTKSQNGSRRWRQRW